jgi:class 3 adenylate cyclase
LRERVRNTRPYPCPQLDAVDLLHYTPISLDELRNVFKWRASYSTIDKFRICVARSVAEELMERNSVQPVRYDEVTIYFSDIVGFTKLTNQSQHEPIKV